MFKSSPICEQPRSICSDTFLSRGSRVMQQLSKPVDVRKYTLNSQQSDMCKLMYIPNCFRTCASSSSGASGTATSLLTSLMFEAVALADSCLSALWLLINSDSFYPPSTGSSSHPWHPYSWKRTSLDPNDVGEYKDCIVLTMKLNLRQPPKTKMNAADKTSLMPPTSPSQSINPYTVLE